MGGGEFHDITFHDVRTVKNVCRITELNTVQLDAWKFLTPIPVNLNKLPLELL